MNRVPFAALVVVTLIGCRPTGPGGIAEARADEPAAARVSNGVAVVELFTSEGCSSCPPADALLGALAAQDAQVYALSFHVDYWDELGWTDRFGSPEYTARQRAYAGSLGARGLYTPEMIVNGRAAFVGSDGARAAQSIARALTRAAQVPVAIAVRAAPSHRVRVDVDAPNAPAGAVIDVAVVEHSVSTDVRAGENAGRTLRHTNVVRGLSVVPAPRGSTTIALPGGLRPEDGEVIAFVQRGSDAAGGMPVLGAGRAPLPR